MKLISHEIPLNLIDDHQDKISDYMYVLLHKMIEDEVYAAKAYEYRKAGGTVYLDNSCFELGESLDNEVLFEYYERLNPDIIILPDVLGNMNETIRRSKEFWDAYPSCHQHSMLVIQGSSPQEMIECYRVFDGFNPAMIGIPFVYKWIDKTPYKQSAERKALLHYMNLECINRDRKHHLLGTWLAEEFNNYKQYDWVHSIDTSNPIMAAIDGISYGPLGIDDKPKSNFDSVYHLKEGDIDMNLLYHNVSMFKEIVNG